jgi:hypothetical protein
MIHVCIFENKLQIHDRYCFSQLEFTTWFCHMHHSFFFIDISDGLIKVVGLKPEISSLAFARIPLSYTNTLLHMVRFVLES